MDNQGTVTSGKVKARRFRFSIRTLAIFVAIVALILACGMWWVTWPRRTADRVVELLNNDQFNEVLPFLATEDDREYLKFLETVQRDILRDIPRDVTPTPQKRTPTPRDRSWSDVIRARQVFIIGFHFDIGVERGSVSIAGPAPIRVLVEAYENEKAFKRIRQYLGLEELEQKLLKKSETPALSKEKSGP